MVLAEVSSLIAIFITKITEIVATIGYPGIFILMVMESAALPVPSEAVMPFAGYLATQGRFNIWIVTLVGTLANVVGSLIAYYLGLHLGRRFIIRYGKYFFLKERFLVISEDWFKKYGEKSVFFSRLLPVVRTFISLPAGIGKMNVFKFSLYTFLGSLPWNFALTYVGFWLGENWHVISDYFHIADIVIVGFIALAILYIIFHTRNHFSKSTAAPPSEAGRAINITRFKAT
ncbi:MAG: DedA family protein [Candidatus Aenigmarchaeota archaeon]|nr:DedA family protein [Candidatus Aenigmarchaeota archaeon]